jgi:two-component system, NarL family, invasion response regulator UvrY
MNTYQLANQMHIMGSDKTITVGLVDDHVLLRKGLANLLSEEGFEVAIQAKNGRELTEMVNRKNIPDVVIADINMPVMDGYATATWLRSHYPEVKILALSMYDDEQAIIRMLHCGAGGYVLKDCAPEEFTTAIHSIHERGYYHSELVGSRLIQSISSDSKLPHEKLTEKELKFLQLICSEMTYREIADIMQLSPRTVDGYRDNLFAKLHIKSRVGLAIYAVKSRLVYIGKSDR